MPTFLIYAAARRLTLWMDQIPSRGIFFMLCRTLTYSSLCPTALIKEILTSKTAPTVLGNKNDCVSIEFLEQGGVWSQLKTLFIIHLTAGPNLNTALCFITFTNKRCAEHLAVLSLQNTCCVIRPSTLFDPGTQSPPISSLSLSASLFFIFLPFSDCTQEQFSRCLLTFQYREQLCKVTISQSVFFFTFRWWRHYST